MTQTLNKSAIKSFVDGLSEREISLMAKAEYLQAVYPDEWDEAYHAKITRMFAELHKNTPVAGNA